MKKMLLFWLLMSGGLFASEITIAVAANVSYAIDELKAEFIKMHPDTIVRVRLGSSGKLTAQINNGAPYGLFLSANMKYPQTLFDEKIAITRPRVYAKGSLAYLSARPQDFSEGIGLLLNEKIKRIAVANPKTAPYGKASIEALRNAKVYDAVQTKLVYAESVSQTVAYTMTATDIGLVAKSSLYSPAMQSYKENINWSSVETDLYTPIDQGIVLLKGSETNSGYKAFYDFILSNKARAIFLKYGYEL